MTQLDPHPSALRRVRAVSVVRIHLAGEEAQAVAACHVQLGAANAVFFAVRVADAVRRDAYIAVPHSGCHAPDVISILPSPPTPFSPPIFLSIAASGDVSCG